MSAIVITKLIENIPEIVTSLFAIVSLFINLYLARENTRQRLYFSVLNDKKIAMYELMESVEELIETGELQYKKPYKIAQKLNLYVGTSTLLEINKLIQELNQRQYIGFNWLKNNNGLALSNSHEFGKCNDKVRYQMDALSAYISREFHGYNYIK